MTRPRFNRILLKLSGEALMGQGQFGIDPVAAAVALCRDNNIPIVVFNIRQQGNLAEVIEGRGTATVVQYGSEQ